MRDRRRLRNGAARIPAAPKDKCARLNLYRVADAFLYLAGSLSSISCEVRSSHQLDGHTMYVAAMLAGETDSNSSVRRHLLTADFR